MNTNSRGSRNDAGRARRRGAACICASRTAVLRKGPSRTRASRTRRGRALVECIVATFLLAVTALSMAATVRSTLSLADDAMLVAHAQAMATTRVESAMALPCGTDATGTDRLPRMNVLWQQAGSARNTQLRLDVTLDRSPIAFASAPVQFTVDAGGICP